MSTALFLVYFTLILNTVFQEAHTIKWQEKGNYLPPYNKPNSMKSLKKGTSKVKAKGGCGKSRQAFLALSGGGLCSPYPQAHCQPLWQYPLG